MVIEDFLNPKYLEKIYSEFPNPYANWHEYKNPIEYKYTVDNLNLMGLETTNLFYAYCHSEFINLIKKITDIDNLEYDPYLHGAGLHRHPKGGHLAMHLDYSIHPITGKERRINLILFLNKEWKESYNGHFEIWSQGCNKLEKKIAPNYNRCVLFRTSDESWHGLPEKINCPEDMARKSVAMYYISDPRPNQTNIRYKANFVQRPTELYDERFSKLAEIRKKRLITPEDLKNLYGEDYEKYI